MEFGIKTHLNLHPTKVHCSNYCSTKWAEDTQPQGAWLEGEPAKRDGSQRDGRDGAVSPFRNEAAADTQSLCQVPRCSQRLLNQHPQDEHRQQRDKTLPATTQHNTRNSLQRDCAPPYTSTEPGEEREAARRGMAMDGCLFNSGDSFFPTFIHSPFHHLGEKPG